MKRAFFVVYEVGNIETGLMLAREAQRTRDFDVVMWSPYHLPTTEETMHRAIGLGSVYIHENTATGGLADIWTPLSGWLSGKPTRLPVSYLGNPDNSGWQAALHGLQKVWGETSQNEAEAKTMAIQRMADAFLRRVAFCEDILVRLGVDALVFAEDNIERDSFAWIAAAKRRGIPKTVVTYGALSVNEAENAYKASSAHQVPAAEAAVLRTHLPAWLRTGEGYTISRLPLIEAMGREMAGVSVANPWLVNTGDLDQIALESESARSAYLAEGFDAKRLKTSGHPFHDRLYAMQETREQQRLALGATYGIDPAKPWLLVAMPPNQTGHRPVAGSVDYDALIWQFCHLPATCTQWQILISPHPNLIGEERDKLRTGPGALIEGPVADLLPLADAYLACVSSTIKWAQALGLPIIDYDCYNYGYDDYRFEPGVRTVNSRAELEVALQALDNDQALQAWRAASYERSSWWGKLDGRAMERIVQDIFTAPFSV